MKLLNLLRSSRETRLRPLHGRFPPQYSTVWEYWYKKNPDCGSYSWGWGLLAILTLGGCGWPAFSQTGAEESTRLRSTGIEGAMVAEPTRQVQRQLPQWLPPSNGIPVTLYRLDEQCADYRQQSIQVDLEQPLTEAVGLILLSQEIIAFDLSGYRIEVSPGGETVTIDLRLDADSQRQLGSLSDCEQKALFGSLRQTLLQQPQWNIQQVQFTNRGEPLLP